MINCVKKRDNAVIRRARVYDVELIAAWLADGSVMTHAGFQYGLKTNLDYFKK